MLTKGLAWIKYNTEIGVIKLEVFERNPIFIINITLDWLSTYFGLRGALQV